MAKPLHRQNPLAVAVTAIRSTLFAILFYGLTIVLIIVATLVTPIYRRSALLIPQFWAQAHRVLVRFVLGQRIVIEGDLPRDAQFVVMKHESMFETLDVLCLFHLPVVAAKRELLEIPVWGRVAAAYGIIGVDRQAGASALRAVRTAALAGMAAGRTVIFFPEGTRVAYGEAPPIKSGFAGLYMVMGVPVVPIAVDSGRLSPRNGFLKRSGTITYRIGETVPPGLPRAEAEARVHAAINALNDLPADSV